MHPLRPTYVEVNLAYLYKNYELFASSNSGKKFICPMVKANAYGHGDVEIVRFLESKGCPRFGVGLVEEGIRLRSKANSKAEILVFGFSGDEAVKEMFHHCLTPVVSDWQQLEALARIIQTEFFIHLKVNTGMNRLGFCESDLEKVFDYIKQNKKIKIKGFCTHLLSSEDVAQTGGRSRAQLEIFKTLLKKYDLSSVELHAFNSTGAIQMINNSQLFNAFPFGCRPGIGLYGYCSEDRDFGQSLYPVMTLKSKIITVQHVKKNETISYGGTWKAPKDSTIAILPIGYADGISTNLSNVGGVFVDQQVLPIVGRVCMDYTLIDASLLENPLGKEVELFGRQYNPHTVAKNANTIIYDIFTRVSERVPRIFTDGDG